MSDDLQFECSACGKHFPADPDAMVELQWSRELAPDAGEAEGVERQWSPESEAEDDAEIVELTPEALMAMSEADLLEIGLTPEMRRKMLAGEDVVAGVCICIECQDRMAAEDDAS